MLGVPAPGRQFRITVMVDYNSPVLPAPACQHVPGGGVQGRDKPPCTFVFLRELEQLAKAGLIEGGDLDNAIVLEDREGTTQEDLKAVAGAWASPTRKWRSPGTACWNHRPEVLQRTRARKLWTSWGDLALVGRAIKTTSWPHGPPLQQHQLRQKRIGGHARGGEEPRGPGPDQGTLFDIMQIEKMLPHRALPAGGQGAGDGRDQHHRHQNVTMNEPHFTGHFPGTVMPGVLQVEAMAQVGGIFALSQVPDPENYTTYFLKTDGIRTGAKVMPATRSCSAWSCSPHIRRGWCTWPAGAIMNGQPGRGAEMMAQMREAGHRQSGRTRQRLNR